MNNKIVSSSFNVPNFNPLQFQPKQVVPKKSILCWSDCCLTQTGFGIVSKHILTALNNTGLYEIDQLAINYSGDFYNKETTPATIVSARLNNPEDPYGNQMFINALQKKDYDFVFIINDTFVVEEVAQYINQIKDEKKQQNKKIFKLVYYYPIDCKFSNKAKSMVELADVAVAYTNFALNETRKVLSDKEIQVIYHGTDIKTFKQIPKELRTQYRKQLFNIRSDNTFMWLNVNRNSTRKDIAKSILAFKEFKTQIPDSFMYCHTKIKDKFQGGMGIDLDIVIEELGLSKVTDVGFPLNFNVIQGFPLDLLNIIYNCADGFITTHLGEGWGLTMTEALAVGLPLVCPNNTSVPEITGNGKWAYPYECKELIYCDNSGFRAAGQLKDIVNKMVECYKERGSSNQKEKIKLGKEFVNKYSWDNVCKDWVKLFSELGNIKTKVSKIGTIL